MNTEEDVSVQKAGAEIKADSAFKFPTIVLGNSSRRFSGVTSTMLKVLPWQVAKAKVLVLGDSFVPSEVETLTFWQSIPKLRSLASAGEAVVFHARRNDEMIQALLLKWLFRVQMKVVFTSTAQRRKTWLTRFLMSQMDGLITTCKAAADYMTIPADIIIPHGVDGTVFQQKKSSLPFNLPGKFNIGIFGRVRAQKGVDLLIEAALQALPSNKDWGVIIVGQITEDQKPFVEQLKAKVNASTLGARVVFTGELALADVVQAICQVDIVTALSRNEGFGLTVLEAMAAGKPVVATKAGAWPDILGKAEIGGLIDVDDLPALVHALETLMADSELRAQLGNNGRQLVLREYSVESEADSLLGFYKKIANSS